MNYNIDKKESPTIITTVGDRTLNTKLSLSIKLRDQKRIGTNLPNPLSLHNKTPN